ncbi:uncharacterized protein LOC117170057 [Belonocnema kinseyi]|uniref:uncharacterized protein LOC117170057 n=1 Tax=Belonocnema kinseyi TaxID=2817044 RepID=UPI00143CCD47|nr:uncharacterized protein LOC117170057 [Belonocnema kinseyi]
MKICTEILLLVFGGFLNFKRADGQPRRLQVEAIVTMRDECVLKGTLLQYDSNFLLHWLQPNETHPGRHYTYIMIDNTKFAGLLLEMPNYINPTHNASDHFPKDALLTVEDQLFYLATDFSVAPLNEMVRRKERKRYNFHAVLQQKVTRALRGL